MRTLLVCGGGNSAQVCCCLFGSRYKVKALSLHGDEAERWYKAVQEAGRMSCTLFPESPADTRVVHARPVLITKNPQCVKDCDMVLFTVPPSVHEQYFTALAPYVRDGTLFAVMPARSGCDFLFHKVMGGKASSLGLVAFETLPWASRLVEWGKTCAVLGVKDTVSAAVVPPARRQAHDVLAQWQDLFGSAPTITATPNVMSIGLGNPGQVVHPGIMYSRWKGWDGRPLEKKALFYHGADLFCAETLIGISEEIQAICRKLRAAIPHFDTSQVKTVYEWYVVSYAPSCADTSSLLQAMRTNIAYEGMCHPMIGSDAAGYLPDFTFRYLTEDVPTGLCFTKGVAELLDVETPTMDKVIQWSQEKLDKEFLTPAGRMMGKDIRYTRAPQAYNVRTREELIAFIRKVTPSCHEAGTLGPCCAAGGAAAAVAAASLAAVAWSRRRSSG